MLEEVLFDEGPACFLPSEVRRIIVGRWEAGEVWRFGEGDWGFSGHVSRVDGLNVDGETQ